MTITNRTVPFDLIIGTWIVGRGVGAYAIVGDAVGMERWETKIVLKLLLFIFWPLGFRVCIFFFWGHMIKLYHILITPPSRYPNQKYCTLSQGIIVRKWCVTGCALVLTPALYAHMDGSLRKWYMESRHLSNASMVARMDMQIRVANKICTHRMLMHLEYVK